MLDTTRGTGRDGPPARCAARRAPQPGKQSPVFGLEGGDELSGRSPRLSGREVTRGHPAAPGARRPLPPAPRDPPSPPRAAPAAQVPGRPAAAGPQHPRSATPAPRRPYRLRRLAGSAGPPLPPGSHAPPYPARLAASALGFGVVWGFLFPSSRPLQLPLVIALPASRRRNRRRRLLPPPRGRPARSCRLSGPRRHPRGPHGQPPGVCPAPGMGLNGPLTRVH